MKNLLTNLPNGLVKGESYVDLSDNKVTIGTTPLDPVEVGDIWFYDNVENRKFFVKKDDLSNYADDRYTAIGVCYIPSSHDVYGDGSAGVLALKPMSTTTPDIGGGGSQEEIPWGYFNIDISADLPYFNCVNHVGQVDGPKGDLQGTEDWVYMPSDRFTGKNSADPQAKYYQGISGNELSVDNRAGVSPYSSDGVSRNELYYTTRMSELNAHSDFNGRRNTLTLCDLATAQPDWRTAATITKSRDAGYTAVACCTWRFHTPGTEQGNWYLPAAGEAGYLVARQAKIDASLLAINTVKGSGKAIPFGGYWLWSSTNHSAECACGIDTGNGRLFYNGKHRPHCVRAVCSSSI